MTTAKDLEAMYSAGRARSLEEGADERDTV
jgi:hypothetical protein